MFVMVDIYVWHVTFEHCATVGSNTHSNEYGDISIWPLDSPREAAARLAEL